MAMPGFQNPDPSDPEQDRMDREQSAAHDSSGEDDPDFDDIHLVAELGGHRD